MGDLSLDGKESPRLVENTVHVGLWGLSVLLTMKAMA